MQIKEQRFPTPLGNITEQTNAFRRISIQKFSDCESQTRIRMWTRIYKPEGPRPSLEASPRPDLADNLFTFKLDSETRPAPARFTGAGATPDFTESPRQSSNGDVSSPFLRFWLNASVNLYTRRKSERDRKAFPLYDGAEDNARARRRNESLIAAAGACGARAVKFACKVLY
ncbi:hypothetical protein EVAR_34537_1 [Eumeta japonica]|uniref:Uncharacterized protein n=1 Tax=Eumeta variegata TaxID=151549 RepID=A0A4C1X8F4_EUMVA|nr:hypothetical protein EVAR_34537_1 [Eumeta japonica]